MMNLKLSVNKPCKINILNKYLQIPRSQFQYSRIEAQENTDKKSKILHSNNLIDKIIRTINPFWMNWASAN